MLGNVKKLYLWKCSKDIDTSMLFNIISS